MIKNRSGTPRTKMLGKRFQGSRGIYTGILLSLQVLNMPSIQADVNTDLNNFFQQYGGAVNVNSGGAYRDQAAGYYTGGSLYARNTVHNSQLASITLPGYRAGCGGIDMHMGAMSFISGDKLVQALRNVGSNMASYAFQLALETMSPQVKNIMAELNDLAQKINMSNINSCEIAATTLGSILPQSEIANKHLCTMIGTDKKYGGISDYAAARQQCGAEGKRGDILNQGKNDPRFAKMLGTEFNLAWNAILENAFLNNDKSLAEFFMSLSGTIVSINNGDNYEVRSKPSLADKTSLLNALINGGDATIYSCDGNGDNKCLKVVEKKITISPDKALKNKVSTILQSMKNKILADEPLTQAEQGFLNSTRLPFYKILNIATIQKRGENGEGGAAAGGGSVIDIMDYSELAAVDVLFQYISEILDVVNESASHIKSAQIDDSQIREFQKALNEARQRVVARRMGTFKQVEQVLNMVRKTELLEKTIAAKLSAIGDEGL